MKHYFKYIDEDKVACFLELNAEFFCERAIYKTKNSIINTYLNIENEVYCLPEGNLKESRGFMDTSTEFQFKSIWEKSMSAFESDWNNLKVAYKIGDIVKSKILCFYPQGIVSNFGAVFNALSDYEPCATKFGKEKMYPNNELELRISDFDNTNRLIKLEVNN